MNKTNKQERDAKGRFVKKEQRKALEAECKNPIRTDSLNKRIEELEDKWVRESHYRVIDTLEFYSAMSNQRNITQTIINELNWFQRRRLRKKLSYYPNKVCGYNMTKDV